MYANSRKPVIGIVAEYDPFHNGHAFHIDRARVLCAETYGRETNAPIVAALSSSFTQRGLPALADKWTRARMALESGADLVLELPFIYACNAGPEFARGAIDTLAALQCVTHLSYGMEDFGANNTFNVSDRSSPPLGAIVDILIHESLSFKLNLKRQLALGASYSKAFAEALDQELPGSGNFVSKPNNSLALSYLLRLREKNYDLTPLPVRREGAGYHDPSYGTTAGATAIRAALTGGVWEGSWVENAMPSPSLALLKAERERGRLCLGTEKLWILLQGLLTRSSPEDLRSIAGMDEGLENLFLKHYSKAASYEDFIGRCVCARYTQSRLRRQTIWCLAGLSRRTASILSRSGLTYIRVLGFNGRGRLLLRDAVSEKLPVVTRLAAASEETARLAADMEFRASRLRELLLPCSDLGYEEKQKPVILE